VELRTEIVESPRRLVELEPEWNDLWDRDPLATPFQAPDWLLPWWSHFGYGQLQTIAVRNGSRLVGLAPLTRTRRPGLVCSRLVTVGAGGSDYLHWLIDPAVGAEARRACLQTLAAEVRPWDVLDLPQWPETVPDPWAGEPLRWSQQAIPQEVCPFVPLPVREEGLEAAIPRRMFDKVRYYRRRMAKAGNCRIEVAGSNQTPEFLAALFDLHRRRWGARGQPGVFFAPRIRRFHQEATVRMAGRGRLRLYGLRIDGALRAVHYCLIANRRVLYYAGGFDPDVGWMSPGTLLTAAAMEDGIRAGAREFDLLRGGEHYKYAWGAQERWNRRLLAWRPGLAGAVGAQLCRVETACVQRAQAGLRAAVGPAGRANRWFLRGGR
jgi:CelD/BcsL family acetyltransferase involved in cellulose biosynthesis